MANRTVSVELRAQVANFIGSFRAAAKSTEELNTSLRKSTEENRAATRDIADLALGVGVALTAAFGYAIMKFAEFDRAMSAVEAATHETSDGMNQLRAAALQAGKDTAYSATEAANAIEELAKAGLSTEEILGGGLKGALDLAAAGGIEVAEAAETAATALKVFGLAGSQIPHVADLLAKAAGAAQGGVTEMSQALNQSSLVASQMGLSIEETVGALASFASAGLLGSDAGTSFKTMLLRLAAPTREVTDLMARLGINAYDAQGQFVGLEQFAGELQTGLEGLSQKQRDQAMATIFGADAIRAANILFREGSDGIAQWTETVDDTGYAADTARTRLDNLAGDVEKLGGAFETALIQGGSGANDVLRGLVQQADGMVSAWADLDPVIQGTVMTLVGVVGVSALVSGGFGRLVVSAAETRESLRTLGETGTTTQRGMVGIANGIGRVTAVLGTLHVIGAVAAQSTTASISELSESLAEFGKTGAAAGELTRMFGENLELLQYDMNVFDTGLWKNIDTGIADTIETITGLGPAMDESMYNARKRIGELDTALASLVQSGRAEEAKKAFKEIAKVAEEQGVSLDELKAGLPEYQAALDGATRTETAAIESRKEQTEATNMLTGSFEAAIDACGSLTDAFDLLNGASITADEAIIAANSAVRDLTDSLAENGAEMDINTESGADNRQAIIDVAQAARDAAQAKYEETGSVEEANDVYNSYIAQLRKVLRQAGLTEREIDDLIDRYASMPTDIYTRIHVSVTGQVTDFKNLKDFQRWHGVAAGAIFNADGNILSYANGGEHHVAQIAKPGDWRIWAEPETGGEAYIPLAPSKRARSKAIWEETGKRLGMVGSGPTVVAIPTGGGGGTARVVVDVTGGGDEFTRWLRKRVRVEGGGNVQVALGGGG